MISAAERRAAIVSKSGTRESSTPASSARSRARRTSSAELVPDTISVSTAPGHAVIRAPTTAAWSLERVRTPHEGPRRGCGHRAWPDGSRRARRGGAARQAARPRRDLLAPRAGSGRGGRDRTRAPWAFHMPVPSPSSALRRRLHAKLSFRLYGSSRLRSASAARTRGAPLVSRDRRDELGRGRRQADSRSRSPVRAHGLPRRTSRAPAHAPAQAPRGSSPGRPTGCRPGRRRSRCRRETAPVFAAAVAGSRRAGARDSQEALLEEPEPVADLVHDMRAPGADPSVCHRSVLLGQRSLDAPPRAGVSAGSSSWAWCGSVRDSPRARYTRVASVGWAVSTSSSERPRALARPPPAPCLPASSARSIGEDSRGVRGSCSYWRRQRGDGAAQRD